MPPRLWRRIWRAASCMSSQKVLSSAAWARHGFSFVAGLCARPTHNYQQRSMIQILVRTGARASDELVYWPEWHPAEYCIETKPCQRVLTAHKLPGQQRRHGDLVSGLQQLPTLSSPACRTASLNGSRRWGVILPAAGAALAAGWP